MPKPVAKNKKKAAALAKKKELEDLALQEQAAVEDEYEFQKVCLEIRIKELDNLNLGLQRKSEYLDHQNEVFKTQLEDLKEEKEDLVAHLQRSYSAEKTNVKELEDRLFGTHQARGQDRDSYENKLLEKDKIFGEMEERLNKKILDLEAKMTALEEFRVQKENLTLEKNQLKKTLEEERDRFIRNYDELENNLIRYRDRVKNESVEMVKKMAKDVQEAGKLCLTATVKSAIAENIRLQNELEQTSKDNLNLREKLEKLEKKFRNQNMEMKIANEESSILTKKCLQYRLMTQELVDRQILLEQQLERHVVVENEFISLKASHSLCQTEEEIKKNLEIELEKLITEKREGLEDEQDEALDLKDVEIASLRNSIVKMAIAAKSLSQASTVEELNLVKEDFKRMLVEIFEIACETPNLPSEINDYFGASLPEIMPCVSYITK